MSRSKSAWQVADHRARRLVRQTARLARWWLQSERWPAPRRDPSLSLEVLTAGVRVPLARGDAYAEPALEAGKRRNLALAAPAFDGLVVSPSRPLSFWRALGRADAARGYQWGMELRGGCVVPAIAGGLCLLSNALFELAVRAGWRILERHGHSLEAIPPAPGSLVLDATVAWPDVDLVIAPQAGVARLAVRVVDGELRVGAHMAAPSDERVELVGEDWIEARGGERWRHARVTRRRFGADGRLLSVDEVARSRRRILELTELARSCISCGELACRDRPAEPVLVALRTRRP